MSLWMVGQVRCQKCGHKERRALNLVEIATRPVCCPACGGRSVDYEFNVFHWNWVTDRLSVGGRIPDRQALQQLRQEGITHVLSVAPEADDTEMAREVGVEFLLNGCEDDYERKAPEFLARAVDFVLDALERPQAKVHIHCYAGARRSMMVMLAVLRALGMEQKEAIALLTEKRAAAQFPPAYVASVEEYIRLRCPGRRRRTGI